MRYFGHITKRKEGIGRLIIEGEVENRRLRGRSPLRWTDQMKKSQDYSSQKNLKKFNIESEVITQFHDSSTSRRSV